LLIPLAVIVVAGIAYIVYLSTTKAIVRIRTIPSGVTISIDGIVVGTTPDSSLSVAVPAGKRSIRMSRDGLETVNTVLDVRRSEAIEIDQILRPPGMVYVRGGVFQMGADDGAYSERPRHQVRLSPYYIDRTEVTVGAYRTAVSSYDPPFSGANMPATNVSWTEAKSYCESQGKQLPTEAQWERACRGVRGSDYAYGDDFDPGKGRSGQSLSAGPVAVASYAEENADAFDMTGNVWEWCADWYDRDYYRNSPENDPQGPLTGERRVLRGGAWYGSVAFSKCTHRPGNIRSHRDPSFGFRCAQELNKHYGQAARR